MKKIDINSITESQKFKNIIKNENISDVFFTILQDFVTQYCTEYNEQRTLACQLFIYYLKYQKKLNNIDNIYEKTLLNFVGFFSLSESTYSYLLSQNINLDYEDTDMYGTPVILRNSLALGLNNPNLMSQFLDLLKKEKNPDSEKSQIQSFINPYYDLYTDTVHMNVIAGKVGEAIHQFENSEYSLFNDDIDKFLELLMKEKSISLESINTRDIISSLIKTTRGALISNELKRSFINTIIYSSKIRLLNKDALSDLSLILTEDEYNRFITYLLGKINSGEILIYRVDKNIISLDTLDNILPKKLMYPENK